MLRLFAACALSSTLLAMASAAPPAGSWKLTLNVNKQPVIMLIAFSEANGKWVADYVDATARLDKEPKFDSLSVSGESIKFVMSLEGQPFLNFDGMLAKDAKKITGSVSFGGGQLELTELRPSSLKKLTDAFELMRETLAQTEQPSEVYEATQVVLSQAAAKKLKADDVRSMVDRATKLSASYGGRWERAVVIKFANQLAEQAGFEDIALAQARKAERMLTDDDAIGVRMEVLETLKTVLAKSKKDDEAKKYETQLVRLEARDFQEYAKTNPAFKIDEFKGRKAKSDRVVLVEMMSNAEMEPSAAFDVARDGLLKAYKPTDVVLMTYHMHVRGGADPLANKSAMERIETYAQSVQRGVFAFVNGKRAVSIQQDTTAKAAKAVYDSLRERIEEELEKPRAAKLALSVSPSMKGYTVKASVSELEKPSEQMMLRFAVVEDRVRYSGGSGVRYHTQVVRANPGGRGFPLKQASAEQTVEVDVASIRETLTKYLDDASRELEFPRSERPLALKNLKVIAYIQNDSNSEVLAASLSELAERKE
jgi:hypothetical protein